MHECTHVSDGWWVGVRLTHDVGMSAVQHHTSANLPMGYKLTLRKWGKKTATKIRNIVLLLFFFFFVFTTILPLPNATVSSAQTTTTWVMCNSALTNDIASVCLCFSIFIFAHASPTTTPELYDLSAVFFISLLRFLICSMYVFLRLCFQFHTRSNKLWIFTCVHPVGFIGANGFNHNQCNKFWCV